jgi:hypothetical protein
MVSVQSPFRRPRFAALRPWPAVRHESRNAENRSLRLARSGPLHPYLLAKPPQLRKEIRPPPQSRASDAPGAAAATILPCGAPIRTEFATASEQRRETSRISAVSRTSFSRLGAEHPTPWDRSR